MSRIFFYDKSLHRMRCARHCNSSAALQVVLPDRVGEGGGGGGVKGHKVM
jgi:hypothetical protein